MDGVFDPVAIKSCVMDSWYKKVWGAWQVLCGRAGIVFVEIKAKDR